MVPVSHKFWPSLRTCIPTPSVPSEAEDGVVVSFLSEPFTGLKQGDAKFQLILGGTVVKIPGL